VETQKLAAGRKIVVHDIEDFSFEASFQSCHYDCVGAVIDIRKGHHVGSAQMKKDAKRINAHSAGNALFAGTINIARSDNDVWEPKSLAVFGDDGVLFVFAKQ